MGYTLQAIIGRAEDLAGASDEGLRMVLLAQGYGMWPVGAAVRERFGIGVLPLTDDGETERVMEVPAGILELRVVTPLMALLNGTEFHGQL